MLTNAKDYYRKLDAFLSEIYQVGSDSILSTVLKELVDYLGKDLRIKNGRLYELDLDRFVLVYSVNIDKSSKNNQVLQLEDKAMQLVLHHGCYIYHEPEKRLKIKSVDSNGFAALATFTIHKDEQTWLFVFELASDWNREEIEFSINTTRKVLNARISSESFRSSLHQAELIQRSLLPKRAPEVEGFEIYGKSISTDIVGGDLYDYIQFDDGHLGIAIGDASGHGLPAALLVRDVVTGLRMGLEKEMKITPVLEKLNRVIHRSTLSTSFTSLFYGELETNGDFVYANAGHPAPLLVTDENIELLQRGGTILGPLPEIKLQRGFAYIAPGSVLVLYSDGLIERQNKYGEPFEIDRLKKLVINNRYAPAENLVKDIIDATYIFGNNSKWEDDITVVVVKRKNIASDR